MLTFDKNKDGEQKILSLNDLYLQDEEAFLGLHFFVKEPNGQEIDSDSRRFYEFKHQKQSVNNEEFHVLQIVEVTSRVRVHLLKCHSHTLETINATVSHEMRNPINSILAQVLKLGELNAILL